MRKKRDGKRRVLTLFLCWVLCASNMVPTELTVWAGEAATDNETSVSVEETAAPGEEDQDLQQPENPENQETPGESETPEEGRELETPEEEGKEPEMPEEEGKEPEMPEEEGKEPETPEKEGKEPEMPEEEGEEPETPEETGTGEEPVSGKAVEEIDRISTMSVPAGAIASGSYQENGSDTTWYIDQNWKLTVEGKGEFSHPMFATENDIRTTPWSAYCDKIKTAEIRVTGMTDASCMFFDCGALTRVDLRDFDTSQLKSTNKMFKFCLNLTDLDVSSFDTSNVTNMAGMFCECRKLTSLDVSGFDTSKVTDMSSMFDFCKKVTGLDVSRFNTSQVTDMNYMFSTCESLPALDVSSFDTSNVTNMEGMFEQCYGLSELDLSNFNTSKVTDMSRMFCFLERMERLDLHTLDTSNVTNMEYMFRGCDILTALDLSGFDVGKVTNMQAFLPGIDSQNLKVIYTPKNLKLDVLLQHTWYQADGTPIEKLPRDLNYSMVITQDRPTSAAAASITATKEKTAYWCGDTIDVTDITVHYCSAQGILQKLTTGFTTNASDIDMSKPGKKTLIVSYQVPETSTVLTAEIELTVTLAMSAESVEITLPAAYSYNGRLQTPTPAVKLKNNAETLTAGTDYIVSYKNNKNAGEAVVVVEGRGSYSGKLEKSFTIIPAEVTIRVEDTTIAVKDPVPGFFDCEMTGFFDGDEEKVTGITFSFTDAKGEAVTVNTDQTGIYTVIPAAANVGSNYQVAANGYLPGTLTVAEEHVAYKVVFDMMGHGTGVTPFASVRSGQLVDEPEQPAAEGFVFKGWYKDRACTKAWNFDADTVQANTTLYARWVAQASQGGIQIQEIEDQIYTGNAIKPAPAVFAADGALLKSGRDYTIQYVNHTNADQVEALGGVSGSLEENGQAPNAFQMKLPYVEIQGKGNHKGTVYRNFHIRKADIGDGRGNAAAGITLKYTDQLVTNASKAQNPFTSLKYKKAMKAGTDFTVTLSASDAYDAEGKPLRGENGGAWSIAGTFDQNNRYTCPGIPKGCSGVFEMIVTGKGNYAGEIRRTIYVTDKAKLIKNVTVTLGKNQKSRPYSGSAVMLTPGYYSNGKYYKVDAQGEWNSSAPEVNGNDLFTVKNGKAYLVCGKDYTVSYTNNRAVGTATMTVTGIGEYMGSKSATFKITGKAFSAGAIEIKAYDKNALGEDGFQSSMPYTGRAVTQNKVKLTTRITEANPAAVTLEYGRHYTIGYKNNVKKGTATMIFTAKPESGYSGSFQKTFKIGAVSLADAAAVKVEAADHTKDSLTSSKDEKGNTVYGLNGTVPYTREGAKPSQRIRLSLLDEAGNKTGVVLKEGTDYTVSYANNTALAGTANKIPTMTFKGKGNYTGSLKVTFTLTEAAMEKGAENLTVTAAPVAFDDRKADDYAYAPKITVKDGKKALNAKKDYEVVYENCGQTAVKDYLEKLEKFGVSANAADNGGTGWQDLQKTAPRAVIKAVAGTGYKTGSGNEITVLLNIYQTKLTANNIYVVVSGNAAQTTYQGQQVKPDVTVYFGDTNAVKAAKKNKVTDETALTGSGYGLKKLTEKKEAAGDYTLTYGANVAAGKNKGSVIVSGAGIYGGNVTVKFDILNRDVYQAP